MFKYIIFSSTLHFLHILHGNFGGTALLPHLQSTILSHYVMMRKMWKPAVENCIFATENSDDCLEEKREEMYFAVLCTTVVHSDMWQMT